MGGSSSTSKSGAAVKAFKPYAISGLNQVQGVVNQAQPGLDALTQSVQGVVPSILAKYQAGDPALNAAEGYTTSTLGRDPYAGSAQLDNLIHLTNRDVRDQVGASFGSRGSFGGTAYETALAKGLSGNEAGLRYQDVLNQQNLQQQAASNAPQQAAAQYLGITPYLAAAQLGSTIPYTGVNALSSDFQNLYGNAQTQTTTSQSPIWGLLGAGLGAAGTYFGGAKFA